jgi:hypothetical protein
MVVLLTFFCVVFPRPFGFPGPVGPRLLQLLALALGLLHLHTYTVSRDRFRIHSPVVSVDHCCCRSVEVLLAGWAECWLSRLVPAPFHLHGTHDRWLALHDFISVLQVKTELNFTYLWTS